MTFRMRSSEYHILSIESEGVGWVRTLDLGLVPTLDARALLSGSLPLGYYAVGAATTTS